MTKLSLDDAYNISYYKKYKEHNQYHNSVYRDQIVLWAQQYSFDELRTVCCLYAYDAYRFMTTIDKGFHWETYQAVLGTIREKSYLDRCMNT